MDNLGMALDIVKEEDEWMQNIGVTEEVAVKEEPEEVETKPLARVDVFPDDEEYLEDPYAADPLAFAGEREDKNDPSPQPEDRVQKSCVDNIQQDQGRYKCKICEKAFRWPSHLNLHLRSHTGERPFICNVCGKAYTKPSYVVIHQRTHTGERPFVCDVCGKAYTHSSPFIVHCRSHTGEKPYICKVCGKGYMSSSNLGTHLRHSHNGKRPFSCKVCGKTFKHSTTLSYHRKKHSHDEDISFAKCPTSRSPLHRPIFTTYHIPVSFLTLAGTNLHSVQNLLFAPL